MDSMAKRYSEKSSGLSTLEEYVFQLNFAKPAKKEITRLWISSTIIGRIIVSFRAAKRLYGRT
jgi:hypothetical protein